MRIEELEIHGQEESLLTNVQPDIRPEPRPVPQPRPVAIGHWTWKIIGMSWLWDTSGFDDMEDIVIMDPHSWRTIRLSFYLLLVGILLLLVIGTFVYSWCRENASDKAVHRGHAAAQQYRAMSAYQNKQKKKD
jgi:hypothetical protein